jgi:putative membrane protein
MSISDLPALNASLNGVATIFLTLGYIFVRRQKLEAHRKCMIAAFTTSILFLTSYVIYHYNAGSVPFTGQGWIRWVYFPILITHILLAMVIVPLVLMTLVRAFKERFESHKKIARWTWPIWMYVSITGVIIYVMLYHLYPGP